MMTLRAPSGVTRMAGAKVYAAKFATVHEPSGDISRLFGSPFATRKIAPSPTTTVNVDQQQRIVRLEPGRRRKMLLTGQHSGPPDRVPEIGEILGWKDHGAGLVRHRPNSTFGHH